MYLATKSGKPETGIAMSSVGHSETCSPPAVLFLFGVE